MPTEITPTMGSFNRLRVKYREPNGQSREQVMLVSDDDIADLGRALDEWFKRRPAIGHRYVNILVSRRTHILGDNGKTICGKSGWGEKTSTAAAFDVCERCQQGEHAEAVTR